MKKYEVSVKVDWENCFNVYANSKEEAAAKAKQAMEYIMEYNISYNTDEVEFMGGQDKITVDDVYEFEITD